MYSVAGGQRARLPAAALQSDTGLFSPSASSRNGSLASRAAAAPVPPLGCERTPPRRGGRAFCLWPWTADTDFVPSARHPPESLRAFLDQELRQVWAVDRSTGTPVYLEDGAAESMRAHTKAHLRCPVPGCDNDRLTTVNGGGRRRDHFRHDGGGGGHSDGESVFHLQAKAMLVSWVAGKYPDLAVREEQTVKTVANERTRRADAMATWPDGHRTAFEVEYKAFSPEAWQAKDAEYEAQDVTRVWLFGHLRRYLAQPPREKSWPDDLPNDLLALRDLTHAVLLADQTLLFVNPVERCIATALVQGRSLPTPEEAAAAPRWEHWWEHSERYGLRLAGSDTKRRDRLVIRVDALDDCDLDRTLGLVTPAMRAVWAERERIAGLAQKTRAEYEAAAVRIEEEAAAAAARSAAEWERTVEYAKRKQAEAAAVWQSHPLRASIIQHYGEVPAFLAAELWEDRGVFADPEHWHCQLFADLAANENIGKSLTMPQVYRMLKGRGFHLHRDGAKRGEAIRGFLQHLQDHGYLNLDQDGYQISKVMVLGNLQNPPPPARPGSPSGSP